MKNRVSERFMHLVMTAEEAAEMIKSDDVLCTNGFGQDYPKKIPMAIAKLGKAKNLTLINSATDGDRMGGILARNKQIGFYTAFQRVKDLRKGINAGEIEFNDVHLSQLANKIGNEYFGHVNYGIFECVGVYDDGSIVPSISGGINQQIIKSSDKILLEINTNIPVEIEGFHDFLYDDSPKPKTLTERVGSPLLKCNPDKIVGIVFSDEKYRGSTFTNPDEVTTQIAENVMNLIESEIACGRLPREFTFQSGMGNVCNALIAEFTNRGLKNLKMHTEVLAESALRAIEAGTISEALTSAFDLSQQSFECMFNNPEFYKNHIVTRDLCYVNAPENIRDSGVVATNTALEADIYGNVNSSHIIGSKMISGLGGSNDFAKMSQMSIFITPSVAKGGSISSIVPMVTHVDSTEHDVDILITEQGCADLRGLSPRKKAEVIIENCAHPMYRQQLRNYYSAAIEKYGMCQTPHDLENAFSWHIRYINTRSMLE